MVFTLVWVSVLEALLVSFLMDLDCCCGQEDESSVDDEADVQQEAVNSNGEFLAIPPPDGEEPGQD